MKCVLHVKIQFCLGLFKGSLPIFVCVRVCMCVYSTPSAVISRSSGPGRSAATDRPPSSRL